MQIKEKGFTEKFICMMILIMKGVFKWLSSKLRKIFVMSILHDWTPVATTPHIDHRKSNNLILHEESPIRTSSTLTLWLSFYDTKSVKLLSLMRSRIDLVKLFCHDIFL